MRLIKNNTELIGIKDQNIKISLVFETDTHIEIQAKLDYPAPSCPHCHGKMIKYDFQKPSKIPLLEQAGTPTLLRLPTTVDKETVSYLYAYSALVISLRISSTLNLAKRY